MPAHLEQRLDALAANRFPACLAAICLFTALVVGYGATLPYFYGIDEPKYAACALEMASTGNWAAPMVDGLPRIEKPPLTYWAMLPFIGAARAMGGDAWVTPFTCRLAGVLCAALAVAAAGLIGRRTAGERAGLAAGLVLASSTLFAFKAMIMKVDVVFTCLMAWSAYALLLRFIGDRPGRSGAWATAFMALGALAKGPFAVAPLFAYALAGLIRAGFAGPERGPRRAWAWLVREIPFFLAAGLIPAASVLAWLGWAYLVSGVDYLAGFMSQYEANTAPSVAQGAGRPTTWGFYLLYVPFIYFFPWGAFVPGGLIRPGPCRKDARGGTLFLVCFMLAFLALCVFLYRMRSSRYLLPAFPVLAVMVGRFLAASPADRYKRLLLGLALALFAGVLAFFVFRYQASTQVWDSFPHPTINHGMWMLGAALVVYAAGFAAATLFQPSRPLPTCWRRPCSSPWSCPRISPPSPPRPTPAGPG